jgi:hypothetical protein
MPPQSQIRAAQVATNRHTRVRLMAEVMEARESAHGACTYADLCAAGFSEAEIEAYRDDARREIAGLAPVAATLPDGRIEGLHLVAEAQAIRAKRATLWTPPVIEQIGAGAR